MTGSAISVDIRQIREEDIKKFREAVDVVAREKRYLYLTEAPPLEQVTAFVLANIARGSPHLVLVDGPVIAGWCNVFSPPHKVQAHVGQVAMGLVPEWRDKGWGGRLMQRALDAADAYGFTRIELTVYKGNPRAHALYKKLGFVEEGLKRGSVIIDGVPFDEIMMARLKESSS